MLVHIQEREAADGWSTERNRREKRMSYGEHLLAQGEVVRYRGRQHWLAPLSDARNAVLLLLLGVVIMFLAAYVNAFNPIGFVGIVVALIAVIWIAIVYFTWRAQEYLITNRRVLKVEGLLDKKAGDSSLDKINDAVLRQGILARILGYGDLEVLTANEQQIDRYVMLNRVVDFKKAMLDAKNALEDGYRGAVATPAAAPASAKPSSGDVAETLAKLAELRDKGAITQAEFDTKKADLLSRM
jgi:uncharacterized membrane protein YdbT with pleckstrin-like domain